MKITTTTGHLLRCCTAIRYWRREQKVKPGEGGRDTDKAPTRGRGAQRVQLVTLANTLAQRRWSQYLMAQQLQGIFAIYFLLCLAKSLQVLHGPTMHQTSSPTQVNCLQHCTCKHRWRTTGTGRTF